MSNKNSYKTLEVNKSFFQFCKGTISVPYYFIRLTYSLDIKLDIF